MTARDYFRDCMAKRRRHKRRTLDWIYLTAAARKYVWIMRGVPTTEWPK